MNIIKTILGNGLNLMRYFWHLLVAVFNAEEQVLMSSIVPQIHAIAVSIQNKQPGLAAFEFVKAVFAETLPILGGLEIELEHTAILTVIATVAHDLGVTSSPGNAGNAAGGNFVPSV